MTGKAWDRARGGPHGGTRTRGVVVPKAVVTDVPPEPVCFLCRILNRHTNGCLAWRPLPAKVDP